METMHIHAYFSNNTYRTPTHYHDCHQILFVTKGTIDIRINGTPYTAHAGNLVIFSRYENHSVCVISPEYERYVLQISPYAAGDTGKIYALLSNRPEGFKHIWDISSSSDVFKRLFSQITAETDSTAPMNREMQKLLVDQLLILIYRMFPPMPTSLESTNFNIVFDLQRRFETRYDQAYSLVDLAREYNVSASSLSHQFKRITGASVIEYLLNCRIASAKKISPIPT